MRFFTKKMTDAKMRHRLSIRCHSEQFDALRDIVRATGYDYGLLLRAWQQQILRQGRDHSELNFSVEFDAHADQSTAFLQKLVQRTAAMDVQSIGLEILQHAAKPMARPKLSDTPVRQRLRAITRPRYQTPQPHQPLWGMLADRYDQY